uniref:hypothetical protein n=1 Tax=Paraburkholderia sp. RL18-101-BIB-B TaxID=3031634 RepID=UPI0038B91B1A
MAATPASSVVPRGHLRLPHEVNGSAGTYRALSSLTTAHSTSMSRRANWNRKYHRIAWLRIVAGKRSDFVFVIASCYVRTTPNVTAPC